MDVDTAAKLGGSRKVVDGKSKTITIRPVECIEGGKVKRIRQSDLDDEKIESEANQTDLVMTALQKMQGHLAELDKLAGNATVLEMWNAIKKLHFEVESVLYEHKRGGTKCNRSKYVPNTVKVPKATQSAEKTTVGVLKRKLKEEVETNELADLIKASWPTELFQKVKMVKELKESAGTDKVIVPDIIGGLNKHLVHAPMAEMRAKKGKLVPGQMVGEPQKMEIYSGEDNDEVTGKVFTLVLDSRDMEQAIYMAMEGICKINELVNGIAVFLVPDDKLGNIFKKVLEYAGRRNEQLADVYTEKPVEKKKIWFPCNTKSNHDC